MRAVTARRCRSDGTPPLEAPPRAVTCRRGRARGKARGCAACGARAWGRAAARRERAGARVGVREGARARALEIVRVRGCARECSWTDARRSPEQRGCTELFIPEVAVGLRTVGAGVGPSPARAAPAPGRPRPAARSRGCSVPRSGGRSSPQALPSSARAAPAWSGIRRGSAAGERHRCAGAPTRARTDANRKRTHQCSMHSCTKEMHLSTACLCTHVLRTAHPPVCAPVQLGSRSTHAPVSQFLMHVHPNAPMH